MRCAPVESRNLWVVLSALPAAMALAVVLSVALLAAERSPLALTAERTATMYLVYVVLVLVAFWVTGVYTLTTSPSSLVLLRLLLYPAGLTVLNLLVLRLVRKWIG